MCKLTKQKSQNIGRLRKMELNNYNEGGKRGFFWRIKYLFFLGGGRACIFLVGNFLIPLYTPVFEN
jgi:hypothetical protein